MSRVEEREELKLTTAESKEQTEEREREVRTELLKTQFGNRRCKMLG